MVDFFFIQVNSLSISNDKISYAHLDKQYAEASTVDSDLTKFNTRCFTTWLDSVRKTIGSKALQKQDQEYQTN